MIKTNIDSGVFNAVQYAAIEALTGSQDNIECMNQMYMRRRDVIVNGLNSLGWDLKPNQKGPLCLGAGPGGI